MFFAIVPTCLCSRRPPSTTVYYTPVASVRVRVPCASLSFYSIVSPLANHHHNLPQGMSALKQIAEVFLLSRSRRKTLE